MSSIMDEVELLRRIPLFSQIDTNKLKLLVLASERLRYASDQVVMRQGDTGDAAYVIINGKADVVVRSDDDEQVVATLGRNDIIGEIAILCDVPRTATVRATGDLDVLKITKERFIRLLSDFPAVSIGVMRVLADRLARTTHELYSAQAELAARGS
ncbi:MAG: cyclic nucleotide-binding domain-containing protein [Rhodobiaceae bacterium]|nr:cyclic nucleotide-binding domain-containing protein [Rhodobiaceae bacterium]MCC0041657.1 cyclic nucleotide-binding domain-containing protein [Rhodobiaceae bacterium]MCC0052594.1 cyclic nucleotide-binding domain-containing protein [Rhodobiaceae bacterium]